MKKTFILVVWVVITIASSAAYSAAAQKVCLYFPHISSGSVWETEIGIVNNGDSTISGTLVACSDSGAALESKAITLAAGARTQLTVGNDFTTPASVRYLKFMADSSAFCSGYEKFFQNAQRVAVPALAQVNGGDLYVSHIAADTNWWTGLALLNTNSSTKTVTITFSDGSVETVTLAAGEHWSKTMRGAFPSLDFSKIGSAVISNAAGIIGLELFGSTASSGNQYLSGILLSNATATTLYYPHIASNSYWWTGIVTYNPNNSAATLTITPYDAKGNQLTGTTVTIPAHGKYVGTATGLQLPSGTEWFKAQSTAPVTGFELFGSATGKLLGGYNVVNINTSSGFFLKRENAGWTGIAFVNISDKEAAVTLTAMDNSGSSIATVTLNLPANGKEVNLAEKFFTTDISQATSIRFNSNTDVVGFQLNGSSDELSLDALPGLTTFAPAAGVNRAPYAAALSRQLDLTIPYVKQQLIGNDPDYDTLTYELISPTSGEAYSNAYLNPTTGMLYLSYKASAPKPISLQYRVTDGKLYSNTATISITTGTTTSDKGTGKKDVDPQTYALFTKASYNADLLGTPGANPTAPSSIDLSGNFPKPGNQGRQNSCVGWATAYALKSYQEKVEENWAINTPSHLFSPAYVYNQINGGQDRGSLISDALDLAVKQGIATFSTAPYNDRDYLTQPSGAARTEASIYKAASWKTISDTSQIKAALANRQPVVGGMITYDSFMSLRGTNSVYNTAGGANRGGHAITIVGYDDNRYGGAFKVINSWSEAWGDNGFFWLPYSFAPQVLREAYVLVDGKNSATPTNDEHTEPTPDTSTLPNLQVSTWATSYDPRPRGVGLLTYTIANTGSGTAKQGANINLMLSKDSTITSSDYYVVYETITFDLKPGTTAYRESNNPIAFQFPDTLQPGNYYLAIWVDDMNVVAESNEGDNIAFGDHTLQIENTLPDLSVNTWYATWDNYGNGLLTYKVVNSGASATSGTNWGINLILDPDQYAGNGNEQYLFIEKTQYLLQPGNYIYRDETVPAQFSLYKDYAGNPIPAGTYYMALWVDRLNAENESNEINNISYSWNTVSIGAAMSSSKASSGNGSTTSATRRVRVTTSGKAYNGKVLPPANVQMRRVEIMRNDDGGISMKFLDKTQTQPRTGTATPLPRKTMKSRTQLVFPIVKQTPMPAAESCNE